MKFISPKVHGALDYSVASVLIGAPLVLRFSDVSVAAAVISIAAGSGLFVYSLLTAYSAGMRAVIPFRVHLVLDASAAVALLVVPSLFGFAGMPREFYLVSCPTGGSTVPASRRTSTAKGTPPPPPSGTPVPTRPSFGAVRSPTHRTERAHSSSAMPALKMVSQSKDGHVVYRYATCR